MQFCHERKLIDSTESWKAASEQFEGLKEEPIVFSADHKHASLHTIL